MMTLSQVRLKQLRDLFPLMLRSCSERNRGPLSWPLRKCPELRRDWCE